MTIKGRLLSSTAIVQSTRVTGSPSRLNFVTVCGNTKP